MAEQSVLGAFARGLAKPAPPAGLQAPSGRGGWWPIIREPYTGAWQRNDEIQVDTAMSNPVLFRVVSVISSDIAKMRLRLMEKDNHGIWVETQSSSFSPVLAKPNGYQNRIQFYDTWVQAKLTTGNAVVLKQRDNRQVVVAMYVLDWTRVRPLVAPNGEVYYELNTDHLAHLTERVVVPASEIIHDRWNTLFHPLVGMSPIYACGLAALQAQEIQRTSARFFRNGAQPAGVLTAAGRIEPDTAERIKKHWEDGYTGENAGRVAVLGDGLKYEAMTMNAVDAQLIERLKWSGETICGCYGVPPYMAGVGDAQFNNNVLTLNELYYSQALQIHVESIELCLDEGLGLSAPKDGKVYGTEFDLDDLIRMDPAQQIKTLGEAVKGSLMKPDEGRRKLNLPPVPGGDAVYSQQQNYSLEALAKRDAGEDPFAKSGATGEPPSSPPAANDDDEISRQAAKALVVTGRGFAHV